VISLDIGTLSPKALDEVERDKLSRGLCPNCNANMAWTDDEQNNFRTCGVCKAQYPSPQFDHRPSSEIAIEEELKGLQERKSGALIGLLISALVFLRIGMFGSDVTAVLIIVFVLFIHELGHAVGMKMYGYRNVHMLFIPLMGAVTSGTPKNPSNAQKAVVSLMGPLPGLLLGGLFMVLFSTTRVELYGQIGRTFLFLNLFNLLPLAPLDGEKFFEYLLFARHAKLELAFKILTTFLLGVVAFQLKSPLLGILAVLGVLSLKRQYLNASLAQKLRLELGSATSSEGDIPQEIPREIFTSIKLQLEQQLSERALTPKIIARNMLDVWQRAQSRAPSPKATLGLLLLYFGTFFIVACVAIVWTRANVRANNDQEIALLKPALRDYEATIQKLNNDGRCGTPHPTLLSAESFASDSTIHHSVDFVDQCLAQTQDKLAVSASFGAAVQSRVQASEWSTSHKQKAIEDFTNGFEKGKKTQTDYLAAQRKYSDSVKEIYGFALANEESYHVSGGKLLFSSDTARREFNQLAEKAERDRKDLLAADVLLKQSAKQALAP